MGDLLVYNLDLQENKIKHQGKVKKGKVPDDFLQKLFEVREESNPDFYTQQMKENKNILPYFEDPPEDNKERAFLFFKHITFNDENVHKWIVLTEDNMLDKKESENIELVGFSGIGKFPVDNTFVTISNFNIRPKYQKHKKFILDIVSKEVEKMKQKPSMFFVNDIFEKLPKTFNGFNLVERKGVVSYYEKNKKTN